ncbi:phage portal protein [Actinobaculum sp. 352]|uniref:phage portal protein n=1 Tax=Actinobaculum sp. 352 TaxID=2490946 RepID=UPI0019D242E4|nr:phage portal protein [Actinobaculum sp. 352]
MPLPATNTEWPPRDWRPVLDDMNRWEAWWKGDTDSLHAIYADQTNTRKPARRTGIAGFASRFFWGRNNNDQARRPSRPDVHVPVATDLCTTSADLLYADPPTITSDHQATEDRLGQYVNDGLLERLLEGAELGAVFGGRFQRVSWDTAISDRPFISTVAADVALPEFRWGHLTAVTFWTIIHSDYTGILRHVERHELDTQGNGHVYHALYQGTTTNIGHPIPLQDHPATEPLAAMVNTDGEIVDVISPGLLVTYFPNVTPQRRWRHIPQAASLGRSDLDSGVEPLMDALDEVYNSWMRDIRLGKARVFADENILETDANGERVFDLDQEIYAPLSGITGSLAGANGLPIHPSQFAIRVHEHAETAADLMRRIIRAARYSASTFGDDVTDADITATEVRARQATTITTRNRKIRLEKPALQATLRKLLDVDRTVFGTASLEPDTVSVDWPDLARDSSAQLAQTVSTLKNAELLSTKIAVQMIHPDWSQEDVDAEVARISEDSPITSPDDWHDSGHDIDERR